MMPEHRSEIAASVPDEARCLGCGYALRGLPSYRCPECGREFDPQDRRTMNFGKPYGRIAGFLMNPLGLPTFLASIVATIFVVWGASGLSGCIGALAIGLLIWLFVFLYCWGRAFLRHVTARIYRQSLKRDRKWRLLILACISALVIWTHLPFRIVFAFHRTAMTAMAKHYYEEVPFLNLPPAPTRVGAFEFESFQVYPHGVDIDTNDAVELRYAPTSPASVKNDWHKWESLGDGWYFYYPGLSVRSSAR